MTPNQRALIERIIRAEESGDFVAALRSLLNRHDGLQGLCLEAALELGCHVHDGHRILKRLHNAANGSGIRIG